MSAIDCIDRHVVEMCFEQKVIPIVFITVVCTMVAVSN